MSEKDMAEAATAYLQTQQEEAEKKREQERTAALMQARLAEEADVLRAEFYRLATAEPDAEGPHLLVLSFAPYFSGTAPTASSEYVVGFATEAEVSRWSTLIDLARQMPQAMYGAPPRPLPPIRGRDHLTSYEVLFYAPLAAVTVLHPAPLPKKAKPGS